MLGTELDWGPIGELPKANAAGPEDPIYRDNAFLSFWSLDGEDPVYGDAHVSTSPNSDGRRARFTLWKAGRAIEVDEELPPGSFESDSIRFDPRGHLVVETRDLAVTLEYRPRFCLADYTGKAVLGVVKQSPLKHYQQGVDVEASITIGRRSTELQARGFRDRTFGFRDEPRQWIDGVGFCGTFDDFDFTAIRNVTSGGQAITDGFILSDDGALRLTDLQFTYDPILLHHADLRFEDGSARTISRVSRQYCPIWFHQGPQTRAPAMTGWSEVCHFDAWGSSGQGIVGHWVRRIV